MEHSDARAILGTQGAKAVSGPGVRTQTWLLGYIRGSASGYRRGKVSIRRVTTAVLIAQAEGVPADLVNQVLDAQALLWEADRRAVIDLRSSTGIES